MVYRDYWALSQWYAHYGRHLGEDNLFVVAHGNDPLVQRLCPKASIITIPRDDLQGFDRVRNKMLNGLQHAFGHMYDWVIRTDADELICLDPAVFRSFQDVFSTHDAPALFALGLDVIELNNETTLNDGDLALKHRSNAVLSGHYSKAWAVNDAVSLDRHGLKVRPGKLAEHSFVMPKGVYLAHLKFACRTALATTDNQRIGIAQSNAKGLPGKAWKFADQRTADFLTKAQRLPVVDWQDAVTDAYERLKTPIRDTRQGILRSKSVKFTYRTVLPPWFKNS